MCAEVVAVGDQKLAVIYPGDNTSLVFDIAEDEAVKVVSIKLHDTNTLGEATLAIKCWGATAVYTVGLGTLNQNNSGPINMEFIVFPDDRLVVTGDVPVDIIYEIVAVPDEDDEDMGEELSDSDDDEESETDPEFSDDDNGVALHF